MNDEPTEEELHEDDNDPATKGFVRQEIAQLKTFVEKENKQTRELVAKQSEETRRHFNVVAENIHKDVAAANADELSLIKDQKLPDHENRIVELEEHAGLPAGPRHASLPRTD